MANIEVNDLFSELLAENERLVNVLNELKSYLKTIHTKYETMIDDEDIKQWQTLQQSMDTTVEEYNSNDSLRVIKLKKNNELNRESIDGKQSANSNNNIDVNEEDTNQLSVQPLCQTTVTTSIQEPEANSSDKTNNSNTSNLLDDYQSRPYNKFLYNKLSLWQNTKAKRLTNDNINQIHDNGLHDSIDDKQSENSDYDCDINEDNEEINYEDDKEEEMLTLTTNETPKPETIHGSTSHISNTKCKIQDNNQYADNTDDRLQDSIDDIIKSETNDNVIDISDDSADDQLEEGEIFYLRTTAIANELAKLKTTHSGVQHNNQTGNTDDCDRLSDYYVDDLFLEKTYDSITQQYICPAVGCALPYTTPLRLFRHYRKFHRQIAGTVKMVEKVCSQNNRKSLSDICESDRKLLLLLKNCTIDDKTQRFLCPITDCDRSYRTKHMLDEHFRNYHYKPYTKRFSCPHPDCNYRTDKRATFNKHIYTHNENRTKNYQCSQCDKAYINKCDLTKHINIIHLKKKFKCGINGCTTMFTRDHHRSIHRQQVHQMKYADRNKPGNFLCDWPGCEIRSQSACHLRCHYRKHTGERPYGCEWPDCQQRFSSKSCLKRHVICHQNLKPFVCQWPGCDYRGNSSANLYAHKKIHQRQQQQQSAADSTIPTAD
ncbi:zinc finger and BTB domain-containing protein 41-like [Oppia nitens]|uniref:zinc finger and BTB domain-containing protein 41-like n=1 Tax=Oppia nitens TaxID=1686743 RepID=UPI0023D9B154|nr:zinc finger and BTB domain-containing protein 41-like [Oppia nitens]